jgi:type II secretory pathway component PulF
MVLFSYRYINTKGKKRSSMIDADSLVEAKEKLRAQKIYVLTLFEKKNRNLFSFSRKNKHLAGEYLVTFTLQLSQLLIAGLPLYESLLSLEEQYRNEFFHSLILSLSERIKRGSSLSEAMMQFPESFDELYCAMVAAGESAGALDDSLERLSKLLAKQRKLKKHVVTAMIYPAILFSFSLLVCFLLLIFVIPSLEILFEDRAVNGFTGSVMRFSHFLTRQWPFYLPAAIGTAAVIIMLFKGKTGKRWLQRRILHTPFLKIFTVQTAMARFSRTMGTLLQGGVSIIKALQIARKVIGNPFLEEIVERAEKKIIEGSCLSNEFKKSPMIPKLIPRMLAIGEEGGNIHFMFHKVADLYEEEVEKTLTRVTALAQPLILVVMGAIVGTIMLAVLLPLTDVNAFL